MTKFDLEKKITFLSGRPCSGKTMTAIQLCSDLLDKNWNVIYFHAEGASEANPCNYGPRNPDQLQNLTLITDVYFNLEELEALISQNQMETDSNGLIVVIDCLELFDCEPSELFSTISNLNSHLNPHFLILTQLPRYLEGRSKAQAEAFIRKTYPTEINHKIEVLDGFISED